MHSRIDPFYLSWVARKHGMTTRFIELAGEINTRMPQYVIQRLIEALNDAGKPVRGSKICILGVAYKRDVDDPRESPSFELMELLLKLGADISYNDPHVPRLPKMRQHDLPDLQSQPLTTDYLSAQDCVLIATDHSAYDYSFIVEHSRLVIDTRNATRDVVAGRERIRKSVRFPVPERYLVTGAAGFIASAVGRLLLEAGHEVVGIDTLNSAYDPRLKRWRLAAVAEHCRLPFSSSWTSPICRRWRHCFRTSAVLATNSPPCSIWPLGPEYGNRSPIRGSIRGRTVMAR